MGTGDWRPATILLLMLFASAVLPALLVISFAAPSTSWALPPAQRRLLSEAADLMQTAELLSGFAQPDSFGSQDDLKKAEVAARAALGIRTSVLGTGKYRTAWSMRVLGDIMSRLHKPQEGLDLLQGALPVIKAEAGEDTESMAYCERDISLALIALGRQDEASAHLESCLKRLRNMFGPDSLGESSVLLDYGRALADEGLRSSAETPLTSAVQIMRQKRSKDHLELGFSLACLGKALGDMGVPRKARPYLEGALNIFEKRTGGSSTEVGEILFFIARAYRDEGRTADATRCFAHLQQ